MSIASTQEHFDVIVIGGSYAGQAAAMQLARARRRVLVIDAGVRRNRFAATSHGFLGQDGRSPDAIAAVGREQVQAYLTVQWLEGKATHARRTQDRFTVQDERGQDFHARVLVLALGVVDDLPEIDGLSDRWGRSIFHCPYCHGYELAQGRIGVIGVGDVSLHQAMMLPDWGRVTLLINGSAIPDETQRSGLQRRGVILEPTAIRRIIESATVELVDDRLLAFDGLFVASRTRVASPIAEELGCAMEEGLLGRYIHTNEFKETSVPGVFACGDAARMAGSVSFAVGDGAQAGTAAHQALIFR
ncbi:NAD(P)/FAD-dependent oxidoreductase [Castellaniella hirudinis]|uniref:NAD(P)/FAD-dependent oxidoreductase n=1 Tax=Castellaniella hirudinis TaxID=1144617 RepID=A0ABV8RWI0_9BURK